MYPLPIPAKSALHIDKVNIQAGQNISPGDLLFIVRYPELDHQLAILEKKLELEKSQHDLNFTVLREDKRAGLSEAKSIASAYEHYLKMVEEIITDKKGSEDFNALDLLQVRSELLEAQSNKNERDRQFSHFDEETNLDQRRHSIMIEEISNQIELTKLKSRKIELRGYVKGIFYPNCADGDFVPAGTTLYFILVD